MAEERETCVVNFHKFDPADRLFEQAFHEVDHDRNGYLDKKEFREFMIHAKQEKTSKFIFNIIDKDKNGKVSLTEFLEFGQCMWAAISNGDLRPYMKMLFDACDSGNKGYLTLSEFTKFMKYTGNPVSFFKKWKEFKMWDEDGNGRVEFEEIMNRINWILSS